MCGVLPADLCTRTAGENCIDLGYAFTEALQVRSKSNRSAAGTGFRLSSVGLLALRCMAALVVVAAITFGCFHLLTVNATTAGFAYLLAVLVIATGWGFLEAAVASVAAMVCFNFFFFPPVGTLTVADPQNWVALFAFLGTAIAASRLSTHAKKRAQEAIDRRQEMEKLYALSRAILLMDASRSPAQQIARQISEIFSFPVLALYDRSADAIHRWGLCESSSIDKQLREAAVRGTSLQGESGRTTVTAIRLGGEPIGSMAIQDVTLSDAALQALLNLIAIGLEKVHVQEAANRAEAARQSDELKSMLLDAIAHEFKTPLTSIKAASTSLLSAPAPMSEEERELMTIIDEEADHLGLLVSEAIQMVRIEAGKTRLNRSLQPVGELIRTVLHQMKSMTEGRNVIVRIAWDLPMIRADAELIVLALRQLLDNAIKYSPASSPLTLAAERSDGDVLISVEDQGPGIPEREQLRIFEKFYRSPETHGRMMGTGMGLAIAREIARAHGGEIRLKSNLGEGSKFTICIPTADTKRAE